MNIRKGQSAADIVLARTLFAECAESLNRRSAIRSISVSGELAMISATTEVIPKATRSLR